MASPQPQFAPFPSTQQTQPFSLIDDEPPLRWQRAVHLAPPDSLGAGRRAFAFALFCWLPIAVWALAHGRYLQTPPGESLLEHYGVHVRCLIAIPLMILGEATLHKAGLRYFPQFIMSGLVDDARRPKFEAAIRAARQWRESTLPWLFIVGGALALSLADRARNYSDEMTWAVDRGALGFGGVWFAYVVRPIFLALLLGWLWRILLLAALFGRLARLDLAFVPAHPDRVGGIGFIERLPAAFAPVGLAISTMLASRWAHLLVHHGATLASLRIPTLAFTIAWALLLLAPLLPLTPALRRAKYAALPSYAAMVAEQGRQVRRRWMDGTTTTGGPLLEPHGIGVIADAATMYGQVRAMRILPIGTTTLVAILLPIAVPMLAVTALQIPVKTLVLGLVKTLI